MKNNNSGIGVNRYLQLLLTPRGISLVFLFPLLILMMHLASAATVDAAAIKFDHSQTGFPLTGAHIQARCSSCHVDGVFNGTPHDCASCHMANNRMGAVFKNTAHIPTFDKCDTCHQTNAWSPTKHFDHTRVEPGSCQNCHNEKGGGASSKPSSHMLTTASCDSCHKTANWKQLGAGGLLPANHLPTTQACSLCHVNGFTPGAAVMNHTGIVSGCATCHTGQVFAGTGAQTTPKPIPVDHVPTSQPCELCHFPTSTSKGGFLIPGAPTNSPTMMNHAGIVNNCTQCHSGLVTYAVGVKPKAKSDSPTTHMTTLSDCSACHTSTTTFLMANLTTPPIGHLPTTKVCSTCHIGYGPNSGVMDHTGITTGCASCHNGQAFTGVTPLYKPTTPLHVPTSQPCELCHAPVTSGVGTGQFKITTLPMMNHLGIASGCASCHNSQVFAGVSPVSKPVGPPPHVPSSLPCENCHASGQFTNFIISNASTQMNHTGIVNGCSTCHGFNNTPITFAGVVPKAQTIDPMHSGTTPCENCHTSTTSFKVSMGTVLPANHMPTTAPCSQCHNVTTPFPGVMNHTNINTGCASCHSGQAFIGVTPMAKPTSPTHVPTSQPCELCHAPGSTSAGGFKITTLPMMNHLGIASGCATCHNNQVFAGVSPVSKPVGPPTHVPSSMPCETCHSTSNYTTFKLSTTSMNHTGIVSGCVTCHGKAGVGIPFYGVTPVFQSSAHQPTGSTPCESCHTSTAPGGFLVALGGTMPANHLPTTQACTICHSTTISPPSGFPGVMNHLGIVSGCATCHNGQVFIGVTPVSKPVNHLPTAAACETCHTPPLTVPPTPGSFIGGKMNHTGIVSGCTNCHNGQVFAGITPMTKPTSPIHVPTTLSCETCHSTANTNPGGFGPATPMNHLGIVNNCTSCHNSQVFYGVKPLSKSAKHIPYALDLLGGSSMQCEFCHKSTGTAVGGFMVSSNIASSSTLHNGTTGGAAGNSCYTCHQSNQWSATNMQFKNHNSPSLSKDCSSSNCHKPTGKTGSSYSNWN